MNPTTTHLQLPRIYALYDNTNIFLDINNDGAYDYNYNVNAGGPYTFNTPWQTSHGTRIFSDKPIHYVQVYFQNYFQTVKFGNWYESKYFSTVPPVENYESEYYVKQGTWYVLSNNNQTVFVDEGFDGDDYNISINGYSVIVINDFSKIHSNKPFLAYSDEGFSGVLSSDFVSNEDQVYVIAGEDSTLVEFDYNVDGVRDNFSMVDKGGYLFDTVKGTRITSTKDVATFGYMRASNKIQRTPPVYFLLSKTDTVSDEFSLAVNEASHSMIGLLNSDSSPSSNFIIELYDLALNDIYEYADMTSGKTAGVAQGYYHGKGDNLVLDYMYYYNNHNNPVRYFRGHSIAYKKIYLSTRPKSKYISPNSTSIFNVRIFNPFKKINADGISVKFRYTGVTMPVATVNHRRLTLNEDSVLDSGSAAATKGSDAQGDYFIFAYPGILEPEEYLDIDFSLLTGQIEEKIIFEPAELSFTAQTWII
ncbi:hypothetical protein GOV08_00505 [Candidatus Woesearchaeota archaeon]|nr:hypothetical protein [Candidatus Woesearchaeota archaeon]